VDALVKGNVVYAYAFCPIKIALETEPWRVVGVDGRRVDLMHDGVLTTLDALSRDPHSDMDLKRLQKKTETVLRRDIQNCRVALAEALLNMSKAKELFELAKQGVVACSD